ncbi:phage tail tape measure protein [Enterococcus sp. LJL90]
MAGAIELATLKAPVVADQRLFKQGMEEVKKTGKSVANEVEKQFDTASKKLSQSFDTAARKIQKSLKSTDADTAKLTQSALNIYKDGYGKSLNDVTTALTKTKKVMKELEGEELETATKRAITLRDEMGVRLSKSLKMAQQEMEQYGSTADQAFDRVQKKLEQTEAAWGKVGAVGEKMTTIGAALTAGVTVPILGIGTAAVKTAMDVESSNAKIVSALGLTEQQGKATEQALKDIYSNGFGESMEDVAAAIVEVKQQLGDIPDDQLVKVTENALVLRDTLGQDMGESLRGINSLMTNFGLSADDAMDLYVKGVQTGLDKTNELGDNLAEYGQLWVQAGFSAKDMFAVLQNGLESGAYNLDKVNDFVKEFTISLSDGRIKDNLSSFSEETRNIFSEFEAGRATSQDVFKSVIQDLENTENQQEKLTLASTVWSALGEDNAMKIIESLNDVNTTYDDVAGSMEKVKKQQNETFGNRAKALFRDAQTALLPLGEALLDIAERYMPKVEKAVSAFSDTLSKMDEEDIERILKIGGFVAIAGPTVLAIGQVTKGISTLGSALKIGSGLLTGGVSAFSTFGGAASAAAGTGGVGAMTTALGAGGLAGALPLIVGVGGLLAVGYGAWKLFSEEAWNSAQRVQEWGTEVSEETSKTLEDVRTFSHDSIGFLDNFDNSVQTSAQNVEDSFGAMQQTISDTVEEISAKNQEILEQLPEHQKEQAQKNIEAMEQLNQQVEQATQSMSDRVIEIYAKHNGDVSKFTNEEKEIVLSAREGMIQAEINLLNLSGDKKKAVMLAMSDDIEQMNLKQAGEYAGYLTEAIQSSTKEYEAAVETQNKALSDGVITRQAYNDEMARLEANQAISTEAYADKLYQYYQKMGTDIGTVRLAFEDLGLSYDEVAARTSQASDKVAESNSILADSANDMSQEMVLANEQWNALVFDTKTGKVKTNAKEEIAAAASTEEGWNQLQYILKHANIDSNAHVTIAAALGESGKWNDMSVEEKMLTVNNDQAMLSLIDTANETGRWNELEILLKEIPIENVDAINKIMQSDELLTAWNKLTPIQKDILANNKDLETKLQSSTVAWNAWENIPDSLKNLLVRADTSGVEIARQALASVNDKTVRLTIQADGNGVQYAQAKGGRFIANYAEGTKGTPTDQLAVVNDQLGSLYEELITPPGGVPFVLPKQRNVILPLPKGTRVDNAKDTRTILSKLPRYESGIGNQLPYDGYNASFKQPQPTITVNSSSGDLEQMIRLLSDLVTKEKLIVLEGDNRELARGTWSYTEEFAANNKKMREKIWG